MSTKSKVIAVLVGAVWIGMPMAKAGVPPDPIHHHDVVRAYDTDRFQLTFRGGEQAVVVVNGDGSTDLDLAVRDANGNLVRLDTGRTDDCLARWMPLRTGTFTIEIINLGAVQNRYALSTN